MKKLLLPVFLAPFVLNAQIFEMVINEVDYDQPSTDEAEFIEIKNTGPDPIDMGSVSVDLINGANGGAAVYLTLEDPNWPMLMPNDYFVICGNAGFTTNCDADVQPDDNLIQNGSPDAIALRSGLTMFDVMSYEGSVPGFVETSGDSLLDPFWGGVGGFNEDKGLSRFPDGTDTDDNNVDFVVACITPGEANTSDTTDCGLSTAVSSIIQSELDFFVYTIPQQDLLMFSIEQPTANPISVTLYDMNGRMVFNKESGSRSSWSDGIGVGHLKNKVLVIHVQTDGATVARRVWIP